MNNSKVCGGCCEVIHRLSPDAGDSAGGSYQSKTLPRTSSNKTTPNVVVHSNTVKTPTEQYRRFGNTLTVTPGKSRSHKKSTSSTADSGLSKRDRETKSQYKHYLRKHVKADKDRFWPVRVFDSYYHACCFNCFVCYKPALDYFFYSNGLIFCRKHFKIYNENMCAACKQPTAGVVEKIHQLTYHTECFSCFYCRSLLHSYCNYALVNNDRLVCYDCLLLRFPYHNPNTCSSNSSKINNEKEVRVPPYTHEIFHINFNVTGLNEHRFPLYSFMELRICNIKKMEYYNYLADEANGGASKKRRKKSVPKNAPPTLAIGGRNSISFKKSVFVKNRFSQSMSNRLELVTLRAANATASANRYFLPGDRVMQIDYTYAGSYMKKMFEELFLYNDRSDYEVNYNNNEHVLIERLVSDLPKLACTYRPSVRSSKSLDNINKANCKQEEGPPPPRISADGYKKTSSSNNTATKSNTATPNITVNASSTAANNSSNFFENTEANEYKKINYEELLNSNSKNININYGYYNKLLEIAERERAGSNDSSRLATMKIKNKMAKYRDALKRCQPVVHSMQNLAVSPLMHISTEQLVSKIGQSGIIKPILPINKGSLKYRRKLTDYEPSRTRRKGSESTLDAEAQPARKSQVVAPKNTTELLYKNKSSEGTERLRKANKSTSDKKCNVQVRQKSTEYFDSAKNNIVGQENESKKLSIILNSNNNSNSNVNYLGGGILTAASSNSANVLNEAHKVHRGKNVFNEVERSNSYSNLKNMVSKHNFTTFNRTQSQIYKNNAMVFTERDLIVMEVLGEGFFGQAVKVVNRKTDEVFVLKRLKNFSSDAKSQFRDEVQLMKSLDHRNLVRFIGVLIQRESLDVVIEYIAGGTLRKTIKEATEVYERSKVVRLTPKIMYKVAQGIASGMAYLHSKDIAHRDLTSKNCLLRDKESYDVVVADFGLSRVICSRSSQNCMEVVGSPYWMAPEMLNGQSYDLNVDIYSYGIILCELTALTKAGPEHLPRLETENFILDRERYLQMVRPQSPQYLCQLAYKCCDAKPSKRPAFTKIAQILLNKLDAL